ncbi:MAG: hypothetical protein AUI14_07945 [Actinobacteria bacterium 13_2_20CM_2_71_6]|nr:MAG: hypothetical protein AUI14_07945 [Actinobacteria bacterium 13_2_20CM_2_71_6]
MRLELRHLRVLLAVADAGSISRAATVLRIAQPGLTAQLHRIEQEFGGPLFHRRPDGVVLTDLGELVVVRARELVGQLDELLSSARTLAGVPEPVAPIRVGGLPGPHVPVLVESLRRVYAGREFTTHVASAPEPILDSLRCGRLDLAVVGEFPEARLHLPGGIEGRAFVTEPIFVGLAADHPLAGRPELKLVDLAEVDWAVPDCAPAGLRLNFRMACAAAGFTPRCRHFVADSAGAVALVRSGHAVCGFYPTAYEYPGMVLRPLAGNPLRRRLNLLWCNGSALAGRLPEIHAGAVRGYAEMVGRSPAYATWWAANGSVFALGG